MDYVTVAAVRPVVINHYILYPGERRVVLRGLAEQIMREYPGRLVIVLPVSALPVDPPLAALPAPDAQTREMEPPVVIIDPVEQPAPGPIHGDMPAEPDDRPRLSDVQRPRPPRKPKAP